MTLRRPTTSPTPPDTSSAVRVLCVDDHAVLIEGLKAQFAIDGSATVVGSLSSAERLLEEVARLKPDVILLDIEMPGPDVFEMADRLSHARPDAKFIFLSAHIRDTFLSSAYDCGASGYFAKSDNVEDIVRGIHDLARAPRGTFIMSPKVKERCGITPVATNAAGDDSLATRTSKLTPREIEIVRLIGKGLSRVEIAKELSRSAKTIDGHQERILRKLKLDSRADLVRYAIREGYAQA